MFWPVCVSIVNAFVFLASVMRKQRKTKMTVSGAHKQLIDVAILECKSRLYSRTASKTGEVQEFLYKAFHGNPSKGFLSVGNLKLNFNVMK